MSKSVKEQAVEVLSARWGWPDEVVSEVADQLAAAGLLNDERAQACVEACKAYRTFWGPRPICTDPGRQVWDAGAAYDEPKVRTQAEIVAELVETWDGNFSDIGRLLDELAASVKGEKP